MKVNVKVIPNANSSSIVKEQGLLKVRLTAPAREGEANKSLIKMLAEYFSVSKSKVRILKGERSKNKVVDIIVK